VRLFIALNFPERVRRAVWESAAAVRDLGLPVRWVPPDAMHLTLKFLAEVPDAREPDLKAALRRAGQGAKPLPLSLGGFGVFPDFQRPRVIWLGIEPDPALELLQHRVEAEFSPLGFPPEGRPFRPHLTLGRTERDARPRDFAALERSLAEIGHRETVLVESLELMRSVPQGGGVVYQVRHSERLP